MGRPARTDAKRVTLSFKASEELAAAVEARLAPGEDRSAWLLDAVMAKLERGSQAPQEGSPDGAL